jgi:hypothetical protein
LIAATSRAIHFSNQNITAHDAGAGDSRDMNKLIAQFVGCLLNANAAHALEPQPDCPSMQVAVVEAKDVHVAEAPLLARACCLDLSTRKKLSNLLPRSIIATRAARPLRFKEGLRLGQAL